MDYLLDPKPLPTEGSPSLGLFLCPEKVPEESIMPAAGGGIPALCR